MIKALELAKKSSPEQVPVIQQMIVEFGKGVANAAPKAVAARTADI